VLLSLVFIVINVALVILQRRPGEAKGGLEVPRIVPIVGALVCCAMIANAQRAEILVAGAPLAAIGVLYLLAAPAEPGKGAA
jgi:APA family basic amino acid/polyamine antiporter